MFLLNKAGTYYLIFNAFLTCLNFIIWRWKLLDYPELRRSFVFFIDIEKHGSAISRWSGS
jgi:hypothetical protein